MCDNLENLSDDSDVDRDHKYNILDDSDIIEEEDEEATNEYDEEEEEESATFNPNG